MSRQDDLMSQLLAVDSLVKTVREVSSMLNSMVRTFVEEGWNETEARTLSISMFLHALSQPKAKPETE